MLFTFACYSGSFFSGPSGSAPDSLDLAYPVDPVQTSGCEMATREGT